MWRNKVVGPIAKDALFCMRIYFQDQFGGPDLVPADVAMIKIGAEDSDWLGVTLLPQDVKMEQGRTWWEFSPLTGSTARYTAVPLGFEGEPVGPVAVCNNALRPIDWPTLVDGGLTEEQAQAAQGGQVHSRFDVCYFLTTEPDPEPVCGPCERCARRDAGLCQVHTNLVGVKEELDALAGQVQAIQSRVESQRVWLAAQIQTIADLIAR